MRHHPIVFAFVSAPIDTPTLSPAPALARSIWTSHRRRGRLRARGHPQGDADHHPAVSRRPIVFAFLSAPIDTPTSRGSLAANQLCGLNQFGEGTYTTEGITKLCEGLKGSAVTSLKCAAAQ